MTTPSNVTRDAPPVGPAASGGPPVGAPREHARKAPRRSAWPRLLALMGSFAGLFAAFFLIVRPWYMTWGARADEVRRALPGDDIIPNPTGQETRAITIRAPIDRVWPWLAQLGQDRGGFYSYDLLENVVGCRMPTEDRLRPDKQSWRVGDKLWMYPEDRAGGAGFATLREYGPGRVLAFATHVPGSGPVVEDGSWAYVLEPLGDSATRFLVRGRVASHRSPAATAFDRAVFEPAHFVMERRTMIGLKQLAEGGDRHRVANHVQVALWTVVFVMMIVSIVLVLRRWSWGRPLAGVVAAAVVFQLLTLAQPPVVVGLALVAVPSVILWPYGAVRRTSATPA